MGLVLKPETHKPGAISLKPKARINSVSEYNTIIRRILHKSYGAEYIDSMVEPLHHC